MNPSGIQFEAEGVSDAGMVRAYNEDGFGIYSDIGLFLVADGMGGHAAGEVASERALAEISAAVASQHRQDAGETLADGDAIDQAGIIKTAVAKACRAVNDLNVERDYRDGRGMGTTIVGVWLNPEAPEAAVFNVGDSRVYLYRESGLRQITSDHTMYQLWLDNGQVGPPPKKNIISRALGPWPGTEVDIHLSEVAVGDIFLLCSDGLTGMLEDREIEATIREGSNLSTICNRLIEKANATGGRDNITVVLAQLSALSE